MTKILCVDDEPIIRRVYSHFLTRLGYGILTAESGTEALQVLADYGSIDGIFTDDMMPNMRGLDLIPAIRRLEGDKSKIPIVVVCSPENKDAFGKTLVPQDYLNLGAQAFIEKPFTPDQLIEAINTYFVNKF